MLSKDGGYPRRDYLKDDLKQGGVSAEVSTCR